MDFLTSHFGKMNLWPLLQHIGPHFWAWLLLYSAITPKSEDKYVVKVFNWSEVHLSEMTCYKFHTLVFCLFLLCKAKNFISSNFLAFSEFMKFMELFLIVIDAIFRHWIFWKKTLLQVQCEIVGSSVKQREEGQ